MSGKRKEYPVGYDKAFPRALRSLIEDRGTTKKALAAHLNKSGQAISYYCDGTSSPDWETIVEIAQYFSVSTDYLLGITAEKTTDQTVQSVCKYTGLSADSVEYLHTHKAPGRGFVQRLIDDVLLGSNIDADVPDLLIKSAQAHVLSIMSSSADEVKTEIDNSIAVMSGKDGCRYVISARDAADLYMRKAIERTTAEIADTLDSMREDVMLEMCRLQSTDIGFFEWVKLDIDEEKKEAE